jgi:hypothetical protein
MKTTEFKTIKDFVDFLSKNIANPKLSDLISIIDYYNGSLGGCSCNRNKRVQTLIDIFNYKILNLNSDSSQEIKTLTTSDILIFYKDNTQEILKQF